VETTSYLSLPAYDNRPIKLVTMSPELFYVEPNCIRFIRMKFGLTIMV